MHYTYSRSRKLNIGGEVKMEWNRGASQTQPANQPVHPAGASRKKKFSLLSMQSASIALSVCIGILVLAIAGKIALGGPKPQSDYVDNGKMQAVFLNGGQVYFGKIVTLNDKIMRVNDIYYLRVNQQVQPNGNNATNQDISLVKLGCELHGPEDSMVINQSQIIFWENLKTDGQVAKAVEQYVKQNPNGQKCTTTGATNSGSTAPTTTPTTGTSKTN